MAGVFEHEWLQKKCDVKRCMKVGLASDGVIAGLLPQFIVKVERLVGDGHAGTVKLTTLNPAITGGEEKIIKEKVLVHDEETGDIVWEVVDDPKFSKMKNIMKFVPSAEDPADSIMTWKLEYEPIDAATLPPKEVEMIHLEVMRALMNYVDTHPDWP